MKQTERQAHGFIFQNWVIGKFLNMAYTTKWDIPAKVNSLTHKSISIKIAKWKSSVYLGDALRQFNIDEDFEMLIAFYVNNRDKKKIINMQLINISLNKWKELWGNMSREKLIELNNLIKSSKGRGLIGKELDEFRKLIQDNKKELLKNYNGKITLHPKIDSKTQRRLQCTISFNTLFREFPLNKKIMKTYNFWGEIVQLSEIKID